MQIIAYIVLYFFNVQLSMINIVMLFFIMCLSLRVINYTLFSHLLKYLQIQWGALASGRKLTNNK